MAFLLLGVFGALLSPALMSSIFELNLQRSVLAGLAVLNVLLVVVAGGFLAAQAAVVMADGLQRRNTTMAEAGRRLRPVWTHIVAASLYAAVIVLVMPVVLGGLGRLLALPFLLGPPILIQVIALEQMPLRSAWPRARALLGGNWLRTPVYLLTVTLGLSLLVALAILGARSVLLRAGTEDLVALAFTAAAVVITGVTSPYLAAANLIAYFDTRSRTEEFGWEDLPRPPDD